MLTVGVDLATQPATTGLAVLEWSAGSARLTSLRIGVTDDDIVDAAQRAVEVGLDCPLGWPDDFISFITAHVSGRLDPDVSDHGDDLRRRLAYGPPTGTCARPGTLR